MRASLVAEHEGIPTVSVAFEGFATQVRFTAMGSGMTNLPVAVYPGRANLDTPDQIRKKVREITVDQVIKGLTVQPMEIKKRSEPGPQDIVLTGSFEEVNDFFYGQEWSDGLPVVPPTKEKVQEFLKFTTRDPHEVVAVLLPDKREATIWNIAVNGVMAGCRPEYMPVLIAVIEAMADPKFGQEHLGNTPATETLITVNGPIIKELGFNYEQGALRSGYKANTSVGRFWRLYLRNVAGFLHQKTDKGTFGGTFRVVLAENEDAVAKIGWQPMSVDQGFKAGDNVITINSCTSTDSAHSVGGVDATAILDRLSARIVDSNLHMFALSRLGPSIRPQVLLSPIVAEAIAKAGYSKEQVKRYFYEHAQFPAKRFELLFGGPGKSVYESAMAGHLPPMYRESEDPDRMVPIVWAPEDFMITVSGDPHRDNCFIVGQNGFIGYPVSKKITLPPRWKELLKESQGK